MAWISLSVGKYLNKDYYALKLIYMEHTHSMFIMYVCFCVYTCGRRHLILYNALCRSKSKGCRQLENERSWEHEHTKHWTSIWFCAQQHICCWSCCCFHRTAGNDDSACMNKYRRSVWCIALFSVTCMWDYGTLKHVRISVGAYRLKHFWTSQFSVANM